MQNIKNIVVLKMTIIACSRLCCSIFISLIKLLSTPRTQMKPIHRCLRKLILFDNKFNFVFGKNSLDYWKYFDINFLCDYLNANRLAKILQLSYVNRYYIIMNYVLQIPLAFVYIYREKMILK